MIQTTGIPSLRKNNKPLTNNNYDTRIETNTCHLYRNAVSISADSMFRS